MIKTNTLLRVCAVLGLLSLGACSGMSTSGQRILVGTAIGAAAGTAATVATAGCVPCGIAIGAGAGAGAGYIYHFFNRTPGR